MTEILPPGRDVCGFTRCAHAEYLQGPYVLCFCCFRLCDTVHFAPLSFYCMFEGETASMLQQYQI